MKVNIIYFSQTKNTYQIAQEISSGIANKGVEVELFDWMIIKDEATNDIVTNCDLLGIGMPVFYYQAPWCIMDWLKKFPRVENKAYFIFATYASIVGTIFRDIYNRLRKKGWVLLDSEAFLGFGSYQVYLDLPRLSVQFPDFYEKMKARQFGEFQIIKYICWKNKKRNFIKRPVSAPFYWRRKKIFANKIVINLISPALRINEEKCNGCGICVNICPDNAIKLINGRPYFKKSCTKCYFCEKSCPTKAIVVDWSFLKKMLVKYYNAYPDYLKYWDELKEIYKKHPNHI